MQPKYPEIPLSSADQALLDRYYAGLTAEHERRSAQRLIETSRREQLFAEAVRLELGQSIAAPSQQDIQARFQSLQRQLMGDPQLRKTPPRSSRRLHTTDDAAWRRWVGASAAGAMIGALFVVLTWAAVTHWNGHHSSSTIATYTTANGQRATIVLGDGTTAILNVASRLEVPTDYASGNHTVRLIGEALFTVSHHTQVPFAVVTGPTTTQVLGTSFVVRRYRADTTTLVAVQDGKVAVGGAVVTQHRLVEANANGIVRTAQVDASQFSFATGTLMLPKMPLAQAIPELNRWYDADIRLGDEKLGREQFTWNVPAGSLADLTELLSVAFNVRVVRDGRVLTLYPK